MTVKEMLHKVTVALLAYGPEGEDLALCNQAMAAIQGERERDELVKATRLALKWWTVVPGCSPEAEIADYAAFCEAIDGRAS